MLVAAAFCPSAPVLHPTVASGAAPETQAVRTACSKAMDALLRSEPDVVVTVGSGSGVRTGWYAPDARGSLQGVGVDVVLGAGSGPVELPLSLAIAAWLADRADYGGQVLPFGIEPDESADRCGSLGAGVAERTPRVAMLVIGDGTACREAKAPGTFDERAEPFDEATAAAITRVDVGALASLDPTLCGALMVDGRTVWQVAAGAAAARVASGHDRLLGTLYHRSAPYGVEYLVAGWRESD